MFDNKIEKLSEELRKEMLELADSREARLTRDFQKQIDFWKDKTRVLDFKLRANGAKYILSVAQAHRFGGPCVYIEREYRGSIGICQRLVDAKGIIAAKVVGNCIEIYDDGALAEVLTQCDDSFINVDLKMYTNAQKYDEIYNQPVRAVNDEKEKPDAKS